MTGGGDGRGGSARRPARRIRGTASLAAVLYYFLSRVCGYLEPHRPINPVAFFALCVNYFPSSHAHTRACVFKRHTHTHTRAPAQKYVVVGGAATKFNMNYSPRGRRARRLIYSILFISAYSDSVLCRVRSHVARAPSSPFASRLAPLSVPKSMVRTAGVVLGGREKYIAGFFFSLCAPFAPFNRIGVTVVVVVVVAAVVTAVNIVLPVGFDVRNPAPDVRRNAIEDDRRRRATLDSVPPFCKSSLRNAVDESGPVRCISSTKKNVHASFVPVMYKLTKMLFRFDNTCLRTFVKPTAGNKKGLSEGDCTA